MSLQAIVDDLKTASSAEDAVFLQRYFKTGSGQYGEGDVFIGVRMPKIRSICRKFRDLSLSDVKKLLESKIHEHRMAAVILLGDQYKRAADDDARNKIFELYLAALHTGFINNWDLIDLSAPNVVGKHLVNRPRDLLIDLVTNGSLWEKRAAVLASFEFLRLGDPTTSLIIANKLVHDRQDLIQKAVGWMLRELGKRVDRKLLLQFLDQHASTMPRTMLRYSLEHLPSEQRAHYMSIG